MPKIQIKCVDAPPRPAARVACPPCCATERDQNWSLWNSKTYCSECV